MSTDGIFRTKLYEDVTNRMIDCIRLEQWEPGGRIPSETALAQTFDVSRSTVREAVKSLQTAGLLLSRAGSGTYVSEGAPLVIQVLQVRQSSV